jgi:hypothetical protein
MATADFFNPGTPKNVRNGELDARIGIITEGFLGRSSEDNDRDP